MTNALDDTMKAAMNAMGAARENAGQAAETVKDGAAHVVASTRSAAVDGIRAAAGLIGVLRSFDGDDALGWVGLARRRHPLYTFALFGAGVAVGAGVGMLLAPMSGQKLRAMILGQLQRAKEQTKESIGEAATTVKEVEKDVEHKVMAGVDAAKDAVAKQVGAAAHGVQEAAHGVEKRADEARPGQRDSKPSNGTSRNPSPPVAPTPPHAR